MVKEEEEDSFRTDSDINDIGEKEIRLSEDTNSPDPEGDSRDSLHNRLRKKKKEVREKEKKKSGRRDLLLVSTIYLFILEVFLLKK